MLLILFVWLADISNTVSMALGFLGYAGMTASALLGVYLHSEGKSLWAPISLGSIFLTLMMLSTVIPSKQGMYQIMAAYGAVETVKYLQQSDDAKRMAGKSVQAIEKMLDDAIKEEKK